MVGPGLPGNGVERHSQSSGVTASVIALLRRQGSMTALEGLR